MRCDFLFEWPDLVRNLATLGTYTNQWLPCACMMSVTCDWSKHFICFKLLMAKIYHMTWRILLQRRYVWSAYILLSFVLVLFSTEPHQFRECLLDEALIYYISHENNFILRARDRDIYIYIFSLVSYIDNQVVRDQKPGRPLLYFTLGIYLYLSYHI